MDDKLTKQDKKFVEKVVETGNLTKSAQEAYDIEDPNYAGKKGSLKVREGKIQKAIQTLADRIPDDKLHKVIMEGLDAGKHIFKNNNESGEIEDMGIEADYAVRHKYLDTALKLKGLYEPDDQKKINILIPVLVKFLNEKDNGSDNGNTSGVSQTL